MVDQYMCMQCIGYSDPASIPSGIPSMLNNSSIFLELESAHPLKPCNKRRIQENLYDFSNREVNDTQRPNLKSFGIPFIFKCRTSISDHRTLQLL